MLPIILDIPIIIDNDTFKESIKEINKIKSKTIAIDTYWKLIDIEGEKVLPSTAVFWLFFWADTKGKDVARQVFRNIFYIRYEDFYNELEKIKPDFKTDGSKNNKVRQNLKVSKNISNETLRIILENFYGYAVSYSEINEKLIQEQDTITSRIKKISEEELNNEIKRMQNLERKTTNNSYSRKQRNQYLMELYKKKRGYKCQFCSKEIKKANGNYYIEACHILSVEKGGTDNENNILLLCPNCHKEFDFGEKSEPLWNGNIFSININGINHEVEL